MDAPKPRRRPGNFDSLPDWSMRYQHLLYRVYQDTRDPDALDVWSGMNAVEMAKRLKAAAPEIFDWWERTHADSTKPFEQWVGGMIGAHRDYIYFHPQTREKETNHKCCCWSDTLEWARIVAWVEDRLVNGAPQIAPENPIVG